MSISRRHYKCPSHSVGYSVLTRVDELRIATWVNLTLPCQAMKPNKRSQHCDSTKSLENQTKLICDAVGPRVTLERCRRGGTGSRRGREGVRSVLHLGAGYMGGFTL